MYQTDSEKESNKHMVGMCEHNNSFLPFLTSFYVGKDWYRTAPWRYYVPVPFTFFDFLRRPSSLSKDLSISEIPEWRFCPKKSPKIKRETWKPVRHLDLMSKQRKVAFIYRKRWFYRSCWRRRKRSRRRRLSVSWLVWRVWRFGNGYEADFSEIV